MTFEQDTPFRTYTQAWRWTATQGMVGLGAIPGDLRAVPVVSLPTDWWWLRRQLPWR
jgi:hypothetical protein